MFTPRQASQEPVVESVPCEGSKLSRDDSLRVEGGHPWEHLALQKLQAGAAARADVTHPVAQARLVYRAHRIATADDGDGSLYRRRGLGFSRGTLSEVESTVLKAHPLPILEIPPM
jgi:hypothetical protein